MPKYLMQVSYTAEGAQGLMKDGGTKRRQVAQRAAESVGGRVESFYFAFGDSDALVIVDLPDNASAAAIALAVGASGGASTRTTVLLTPEEVDQATKKSAMYRPPGQ
jgi:uncharacterized protein with GYD domain